MRSPRVWKGLLALIGVLLMSGTVVLFGHEDEQSPDGKGKGKDTKVFHGTDPKGQAGRTTKAGNGISYHGGALMLGTIKVYYIWYGNWSALPQSGAVPILTDLAQNIGGSPYYNINTTYVNGSNVAVSNAVAFGGSTTDNYSRGTALSDTAIAGVVSDALTSGRLPTDTNGVYFVLTSKDVNATSGFCTQYCGWHSWGTLAGANIKYSFVGNPDRCPASCEAQTTNSPNGNPGADGMASIITHELEEAATDPNFGGYWDNRGFENADKCAWTFAPTYPAINGSLANMKLGARDFLIQRNWVNAAGGFCAVKYP